jgi:hypothetical protein
MEHPSLENLVLTALRQAVAEGHLKVAEHLLRALETMEPTPAPDSATAAAYRLIARED